MTIVDFPINNGDFPVRYVNLPEGNPKHCSMGIPNNFFLVNPQLLLLSIPATFFKILCIFLTRFPGCKNQITIDSRHF